MCGVSCLCSVAVGGGGPPSRGVFQFLLLVFCVLCCERLRLGHRWFPVCLCRRPLRPAAGFGLCAYTGGVPVPFPAAVGGGMLVVRPGTVQARRATSARSFPRDGRSRGALPSRCAPPVGAPSRSGGFVQWFVLPPSSPWSSSRPAQRAPVFQVWRRSPTATRSGLGLSAFGSTASMRPSRRRAAAPAARPGLDSAEFRIVPPCLRSGRAVHWFRPSHLSPPHPLSSPGTRYAARVTPCTVRALGPGTAEGDVKWKVGGACGMAMRWLASKLLRQPQRFGARSTFTLWATGPTMRAKLAVYPPGRLPGPCSTSRLHPGGAER